jgi:hypothetical protein
MWCVAVLLVVGFYAAHPLKKWCPKPWARLNVVGHALHWARACLVCCSVTAPSGRKWGHPMVLQESLSKDNKLLPFMQDL